MRMDLKVSTWQEWAPHDLEQPQKTLQDDDVF
jgi:hypothetical protein